MPNKKKHDSNLHGFSGQQIVLSDGEMERYREFAAGMFAEFRPSSGETRELLQQYIDLRWNLQQITVEQMSLFSSMNELTGQFVETGDFAGLDKALKPTDRRLRTLDRTEQHCRLAASKTLVRYNEVEKQHRAPLKTLGDLKIVEE
jgi:hypothetical protein